MIAHYAEVREAQNHAELDPRDKKQATVLYKL